MDCCYNRRRQVSTSAYLFQVVWVGLMIKKIIIIAALQNENEYASCFGAAANRHPENSVYTEILL